MQYTKLVLHMISGTYPAIHIQIPQIQAQIVFIPGSALKIRALFLEIAPRP